MKKLLQKFALVTVLLFAEISFLSAQNILGITMMPQNPTSNDTITFYADCQFSSGTCYSYNTASYTNGNYVFAYANHCLGTLSFICNDMDTFTIPPLAAGNYNFVFHLESGFLPSCNPGIVAGPTDTVPFIVAAATGVSEQAGSSSFNITPNPSTGNFCLSTNDLKKGEESLLELLSVSGMVIEKFLINQDKTTINIDLPAGIYLCRLNNNSSTTKKLVVIK